jgi:hypothetical protein
MTGPLVVLGVLTVVGGWLNIRLRVLGLVGCLDHWLERSSASHGAGSRRARRYHPR